MIMNNTGTFKNVQVNVNFSKFLPKNFKIDRSWLKLETEKKIELIYYMFAICGGYVIKFSCYVHWDSITKDFYKALQIKLCYNLLHQNVYNLIYINRN